MRMRLSRVKGTTNVRFKSSASKLSHPHLLEHKEGPFFREVPIVVDKDQEVSINKFMRCIKQSIKSTADLMLVYNSLRRLCHVLGASS